MCVHVQSCPTLCDPMNCSPPGSSVHGIFQTRIQAISSRVIFSWGPWWILYFMATSKPLTTPWSSLTTLLPFDLIAFATLQHNIQFNFQHSLHLLSRSSLWDSWDGNSMPKWIFVLVTNGLVGHKGAHCIVRTQRFAEWIICPYVLINNSR